MSQELTIHVGRLRGGEAVAVRECLSPDFLCIEEGELSFCHAVEVDGEVALVDEYLILRFGAKTLATLPCLICNESVDTEVSVEDVICRETVSEVKSGVFDFSGLVREELLLEVPSFAECGGGRCQHRGEVDRYLKEGPLKAAPEEEEGYQPFVGIDLHSDKK